MDNMNVNKAAPLKNVAAFSTLIRKVVDRRLDLPGLACFFGASGLGKTKAAIKGANMYRAAYVECGQFTTARSLLASILRELGVANPRGTVTDMIDECVRIMISDVHRPVIVDEAHHIAHKKFVDLLRELHDKSQAPVILIGEETLPKQLEAFERVHNRMLDWVPAVPCDLEDFRHLSALCCSVAVKSDLAEAILAGTHGNTRRIVVNLSKVDDIARQKGITEVSLDDFGGRQAVIGGKAPLPRRAA
jgi:DNA transposition AAA+ family ATPase|tara:strand:- start:50141 stop:50881 length:741 start_codon:yes stop_codon:yes gene_type:complete